MTLELEVLLLPKTFCFYLIFKMFTLLQAKALSKRLFEETEKGNTPAVIPSFLLYSKEHADDIRNWKFPLLVDNQL